MRLIDADKAVERYSKELHKLIEAGCDPFAGSCEAIRNIMQAFDRQPTAYSVESVVRELETISTFYAHGAEGDKDMGYEYLTIRKYGISDGLDIAIEIVRGGRND